MRKRDVLSFIFTDKTIISLPLEIDGIRHYKDQDGVIMESYSLLTQAEIVAFKTKRFLNWKLEAKNSKSFLQGKFTKHIDLIRIQEEVIIMALAYEQTVQSEIQNYIPLLDRTLEIEQDKFENSISRRISQDVMDKVWRRDNGKCVQCGRQEKLEFDHIIPFSKGGSNTYRNIQLLCENCNRSKSNLIG